MSETPTDLAESALLEKARAGDFQAFADLCEPCRKPVCAYLAGAGLADPSDAEDVFMDAILRAKRALSAFRGTSSFATWITTIARNVALDRRRADAAHPLASLDAAPRNDSDGTAPEPRLSTDDAYPNPSASPIPGESLDSESRIALIRRALEAQGEGQPADLGRGLGLRADGPGREARLGAVLRVIDVDALGAAADGGRQQHGHDVKAVHKHGHD